MTDATAGQEFASATEKLAALRRQADDVRAQLRSLRRELAEVQDNFNQARAVQMLQANEALVLAALRAEAVAETAAGRLDELAQSSQRDALTGTPNRLLMGDRMASAIGMARRHGSRVAVLFIDLNEFKQVNDTLGHAAGDAALQAVAGVLESVVRETDTVSRHGGDEFLVLLPEISQDSDAARVAQQILAALAAAPLRVGDASIPLPASIGIAVFPEDGDDTAALVAHADAAMYSVKKEGRHAYRFYSAGMASEARAPRNAGAALAGPA